MNDLFDEPLDSYYNFRKDFSEKLKQLEDEKREQSINISKLKDRYLYKIDARRSKLGIWIEEMESFLISRFKTGNNILFDENHFDVSNSFGTAWPMEEIEKVPVEVPKPFKYDFDNDSEEYKGKLVQIKDYLNKRLKEMDLLDEYDKQILKQENDE